MQKKSKAREKIENIRREIEENAGQSMNALLAPELCDLDEENLISEMRFRKYEWESNERGEVHGGAISAMFDTAMGITVLAYCDSVEISTADLSVSFIRPFLGESFIFRSEIIHLGRSLVRVRAIAYDEASGKTLASATTNFVHLK